MKKFAKLFHEGNFIIKTMLTLLSMVVTTIALYSIYSIIFVFISTLYEGSIFVSSLLGVVIVLIVVTTYPKEYFKKGQRNNE